jgi:ABC-type transport system involved in multi-copper enzyme maturation permease subunit
LPATPSDRENENENDNENESDEFPAPGARRPAPIMIALAAIIRKELTLLMRSRRAPWALAFILLSSGTVFLIDLAESAGRVRTLEARATFARDIFSALVYCQLIAFALCATVLAASAFTIERERGTMELLVSSGFRRGHLVLGKWCATVAFLLLLSVMMLPIEALVFALGGVGLDELSHALVVIGATVVVYGMFGLLISCHMRRSLRAMIVAVALIGLWNFAGPILIAMTTGLLRFSSAQSNWTSYMIVASPLLAMALPFEQGSFGLAPGRVVMVDAVLVAVHLIVFGVIGALTVRRLSARERREDEDGLIPARLYPAPPPPPRRARRPSRVLRAFARPLDALGFQNPVFFREAAFGGFAQSSLFDLFLLGALFISLLLCPMAERGNADLYRIMATMLLFGEILFLTLWGATSISLERQQKTWDLLCATPLGEWRIVLGKLAVLVRAMFGLAAIMAIVPTLCLVLSHLTAPREIIDTLLAGAWTAVPGFIAFVFFYGALMLYCSSRNTTPGGALILAYALIFGFNILPVFVVSLFHSGQNTWVEPLRNVAVPLVSPSAYFWDDTGWLYAEAGVTPVVVHFALLSLLTGGLLLRAVHHVRRGESHAGGDAT